jgi:hypothetical protein
MKEQAKHIIVYAAEQLDSHFWSHSYAVACDVLSLSHATLLTGTSLSESVTGLHWLRIISSCARVEFSGLLQAASAIIRAVAAGARRA